MSQSSVMMTLQLSSSTPVNIQAKLPILGLGRYHQKYSPKLPSIFPSTSISNAHQIPDPILPHPPVYQVHLSYTLIWDLNSLNNAVNMILHA